MPSPGEISGKTIFISPLDWGMGHATRCIPLIKFLARSNTVIIGTSSFTREIFEAEAPGIELVVVPAYDIRYAKGIPVWLKIIFDAPRIFNVIANERKFISDFTRKRKIDIIISDNRFGMRADGVTNIFITHQLHINAGLFSRVATAINRRFIREFDEVWVPDYAGNTESLSGSLSHGPLYHPSVRYIGPQSRIHKIERPVKYDYMVFFSGPQPQLSQIETIVYSVVRACRKKTAFITKASFESTEYIDVFTRPDPAHIESLMAESRCIIARSGYTSLMEFYQAEKRDLILIPTPGQPEQEYLARLWEEKFHARTCTQRQARRFLTRII
jgi:hypothetical protein